MVALALQTEGETLSGEAVLLPESPQWGNYATLFEDKWRVSPRTTLSLGLRYDLEIIPLDETDKRLMNLLQSSFPLEPQPFELIASKAELDPEEVKARTLPCPPIREDTGVQ